MDITVAEVMTAFAIMCACLIALYVLSRSWPPAQPFEDRLLLEPEKFWTHIANSLLVSATLIYLSTLALRRAMKRR